MCECERCARGVTDDGGECGTTEEETEEKKEADAELKTRTPHRDVGN